MRRLIWASNKNEDDVSKEERSSSSSVKSVSNRIYFFAEVKSETILQLNEEITDMRDQHQCESITRRISALPIYLHINSDGGDVFDGISGMDTILRCDVPVYSVIDGIAASAATFLSVVANKRLITPHSYILIHQLSSVMWGNYQAHKDHMENLDELMKTIKGIYLEYTKIPEEELESLLKRDLYLNADKALKYGLVDEIF